MKHIQGLHWGLHWQKLIVPFICMALAIVASPYVTEFVMAADNTTTPSAITAVSGELPTQGSRHWLGLESIADDDKDDGSTVKLRLSYDPQDDALDGLVNFAVLSEDGLRAYRDGAKLQEVNLATGSPDQPEKEDLSLMTASFIDRVHGRYTVVVYNNSTTPVRYSLSVEGGLLRDESGQTFVAGGVAIPVEPVAPVSQQKVVSSTAQASNPTTLVGSLPAHSDYIWLGLKATGDNDESDGKTVTLWLSYDPQDDALDGLVNFYILSPEGLRNHQEGLSLREANLAMGNPDRPEKEDYAVNVASFTEHGYQSYSVVLFNQSDRPVQYKLWVEGGILTGGVAQALPEVVVRTDMGNPAGEVATSVSTVNNVQPTAPTAPTASVAQTPSSTRMSGEINKAYEWHFATVRPVERDGQIKLTVDVEPDNNQDVQFYVLSPDSLRSVIDGSDPRLVNLGAGTPVDNNQDGERDQGKLAATIGATGNTVYTILIFSSTDAAASYTLTVEEGELVQ